MEYIDFYRSKTYSDKNFDIIYGVFKIEDSFGIESYICGGNFYEKAVIGNCREEKAKELAMLFAKKGVHPVHIEDIISDMMF